MKYSLAVLLLFSYAGVANAQSGSRSVPSAAPALAPAPAPVQGSATRSVPTQGPIISDAGSGTRSIPSTSSAPIISSSPAPIASGHCGQPVVVYYAPVASSCYKARPVRTRSYYRGGRCRGY